MSVGRELNTRCSLSWLTVSFASNRPRIWSTLRIRIVMSDSLVGSGVWRPCLGAFPYFARKPSPMGDRGVCSAECDRARWLTVVTTPGAAVLDSSSPPSSPSSGPACHYINSGALGQKTSFCLCQWKHIFCLLPILMVSQNTDLSVDRFLGTGCTKWSLISLRGFCR